MSFQGSLIALLFLLGILVGTKLDVENWPCELCHHNHKPGKRCGAGGKCECRA